MVSKSEVGHAKNVANFQTLIEFVKAYGTAYNPTKNNLKLPQLIAIKETAEASLVDVMTKKTHYNSKVNERILAFSNIKSLSTRLINALETTDATKETIGNAKTFNRKMQGKKAPAIQKVVDENTPVPSAISSSQQSYDQLIQHLSGIKSILEIEPSYNPNEVELQVESINSKIEELFEKNKAVAETYTSISNSRVIRNKTLYANSYGLVDIALEVKKYVKSVFGATSPEFAQIKGIVFIKPKV